MDATMIFGLCLLFVGWVAAGASRNEGFGLVVSFAAISVGALLITSSVYGQYGHVKSLDPGTSYLVTLHAKPQSGEILVLQDVSSGYDRIMKITQYPPYGFQEVKTSDGRSMLVPINK